MKLSSTTKFSNSGCERCKQNENDEILFELKFIGKISCFCTGQQPDPFPVLDLPPKLCTT